MTRRRRYTIRLTASALDDLDVIRAFVDLDSPSAAQHLMERIVSAIDSLEHFPLRCPLAEEGAALGVSARVLNVFRYRVLYLVVGREVEIIRVRHSAQRRDADAPGL